MPAQSPVTPIGSSNIQAKRRSKVSPRPRNTANNSAVANKKARRLRRKKPDCFAGHSFLASPLIGNSRRERLFRQTGRWSNRARLGAGLGCPAVADVRHRQDAHFAAGAAQRGGVVLGHLGSNDDVVGALREKNRNFGRQRAGRVFASSVCQGSTSEGCLVVRKYFSSGCSVRWRAAMSNGPSMHSLASWSIGGHRSAVDHLVHIGIIDPLPGPQRHRGDVLAADGIDVVVHQRHQIGGGSRRRDTEQIQFRRVGFRDRGR